jgi:hypothetical protein
LFTTFYLTAANRGESWRACYIYDGYYNAVAYLRPYGSSYKSYGYAIKSGYYQDKSYNSKSDYESNTWWWTEDGWGDAGDTEGGILDGIPTGLTN